MIFLYISLTALIIASFTSFITYRLGTGQDMAFSYSKCTKCNYRLRSFNLVPLFSWLFQKGRCSVCKDKISKRYPAIEIFFVLIFNLIAYANNFQLDYHLIFLWTIATIMVAICIVDIEYYFAPMSLQILLLLSVVTYSFVTKDDPKLILQAAFSGFIYVAFFLALHYGFLLIAKKEAIGVDDIKLFYTIGIFIGLGNFVEFTFYTGFFGMIFGAFWTKVKNDDTFPFAPAILTSAFLCFILDGKFELINFLIVTIAKYIL